MAAAIAIIGDGAMPTVCCRILSDNGCRVRLCTAFPENAAALRAEGVNRRYLPDAPLPAGLLVTTEPAEAFDGADLVLSAVPTQFVRTWWRGLAAAYPPGLPAVSAAKGIENETLLRPTQIIADVLDGAGKAAGPLAALSGPNIAHELVRKLPATAVAASLDPALARRVQQLLTTPYLRIYTNADMTGVEMPITTAVHAILFEGLPPRDAIGELMSRRPKDERESL